MIKRTLYPKTKRISSKYEVQITEKLDGSNIGFFKLDGKLHVAQRNCILPATTRDKVMYKGLVGWLDEHGKELEEELHEGAYIGCEWMGMGKLKYPEMGKVQMFCKANIDGLSLDELVLKNIYYQQDLFLWSFISQEIPQFIHKVPIVEVSLETPDVTYLDKLYEKYCEDIKRDVEGFIILANGSITKYVRKKNGSTTPHKE